MDNYILWMVELGNAHVFVYCEHDRETAKRKAAAWLGHNYKDNFIVTPLTLPGDRIHMDLTLNV